MEKGDLRFYHPELDCLRFVAFLGVFVYHLEQQFHTVVKLNSTTEWMFLCIVQSGVFGVDLFFCLSSFLITILLLREHALRGSIDIRAFWIRRILRIWPLYYLFLILSATVIPYWLQGGQLFGWRLFRYWIFVGNWDATFHDWLRSPAGPLWSVSIEEQFYMIWPLLLFAVKPKRIMHLAVVLLVGANVFRCLHQAPSFVQQWANTLYHVDPIAWGIIGAGLAHANRLDLSALLRVILLFVGLAVTPAYFFLYGFQTFFDGKDKALYPISSLCCLLIVVSLYNAKALPWNHWFFKTWAYLGRISYGLYVFHMLAITWVVLRFYSWGYYDGGISTMFSKLKPAMSVPALALTILMAWVSYTFLETPFLKLKKKFTYIPSSPADESARPSRT